MLYGFSYLTGKCQHVNCFFIILSKGVIAIKPHQFNCQFQSFAVNLHFPTCFLISLHYTVKIAVRVHLFLTHSVLSLPHFLSQFVMAKLVKRLYRRHFKVRLPELFPMPFKATLVVYFPTLQYYRFTVVIYLRPSVYL